jgi:hypothetical protein
MDDGPIGRFYNNFFWTNSPKHVKIMPNMSLGTLYLKLV